MNVTKQNFFIFIEFVLSIFLLLIVVRGLVDPVRPNFLAFSNFCSYVVHYLLFFIFNFSSSC
jgi:hypothetical protein